MRGLTYQQINVFSYLSLGSEQASLAQRLINC